MNGRNFFTKCCTCGINNPEGIEAVGLETSRAPELATEYELNGNETILRVDELVTPPKAAASADSRTRAAGCTEIQTDFKSPSLSSEGQEEMRAQEDAGLAGDVAAKERVQHARTPPGEVKNGVRGMDALEVIFQRPLRHTVSFRRQPVGVTFIAGTLKLSEATGHAEELGVEAGMTVTCIAGNSQNISPDEFKKGVASLQKRVPTLKVTFIYGSGFESGEETKAVVFTHQPLGLTFGQTAPLHVTEVTGHALRMGVGVGWRVKAMEGRLNGRPSVIGRPSLGGDSGRKSTTSIGSNCSTASQPTDYRDITELTRDEAISLLHAGMNKLPMVEAPLKVGFATRDGLSTVFFAEKPMGCTFEKASLTVADAKDQAAELGIKAGWTVQDIQDTDASSLPYEKAYNLLKWTSDKLPQRPPTFEVQFERPVDATSVIFTTRPLAIQLEEKQYPLKVAAVNPGPAMDAGVEAGWTITAVDGLELGPLGHGEARAVLSKAEAMLPAA